MPWPSIGSAVAAGAATQDARAILEAERFSNHAAVRAGEPVAPTSLFQIGGTGGVIREKSLRV